jgi:hypothetical protein
MQTPCFEGLTSLSLNKTTGGAFQESTFFGALDQLSLLERVHLECLPIEGSAAFNHLCHRDKLLVLRLVGLKFRTAITGILPSGVVRVDLSESDFRDGILRSAIRHVLRKDAGRAPIIFQLRGIKFSAPDSGFIRRINPNMSRESCAEFDFSENAISRDMASLLFVLLSGEKRLRMLVLSRITINFAASEFLAMLSDFVKRVPIVALDLSGDFDKAPFAQFIRGLSRMPQLRRLLLRPSRGGPEIVRALAEVIPALPLLTEVVGDHLNPKSNDAFFSLWKAIAEHPGIRSCDQPTADLLSLKLKQASLSEEHRRLLVNIRDRPRPSSVEQRTDFMIQAARKPDVETDPVTVFSVASTLHVGSLTAQQAVDRAENARSEDGEMLKGDDDPQVQVPPPLETESAIESPNVEEKVPDPASARVPMITGLPPSRRFRIPGLPPPLSGSAVVVQQDVQVPVVAEDTRLENSGPSVAAHPKIEFDALILPPVVGHPTDEFDSLLLMPM